MRKHDKQQPASESSQPEQDQRGTEQSPVVIKIAPDPQAQEEAAQAKREKEEKAATEYRAEITTWIVAGATALQAIFLFVTIRVMNKTARRQLQAYLMIRGKAPLLVKNANGLRVSLRVKNVGATPAFKLRHWIGRHIKFRAIHIAHTDSDLEYCDEGNEAN